MNELLLINKIKNFEQVANWLPGIKIIQRHSPYQNLYLCETGQNYFGLSLAFFRHLPLQEFKKKIFDCDDKEICLIGSSTEVIKSQLSKKVYIRYSTSNSSQEPQLILVNILLKDQDDQPLITLTQIIPSNLLSWAVLKSVRIVKDLSFKKQHYDKFRLLSKRNKEVLSLMVKGISAEEIGQQLFIGVNTVNTHKRRVKEILEIKSNYELLQYGLAFDLI